MTVSYQYDVASSSTGGFFRLLWRWRGSIWKLLYKELVLFIALYLCIALTYDFLMPDPYKRYYERIVIFCSSFVEIIPLSFILGFYVSFTATRWWQQYTAIPWPDKLMNIIALYVPGSDETSRILRRTLMRYLNLTLVLVLRSISIPVKRRFPTKDHLVEAGFITKPELEMYSSVPSHEFNTFWIPCTWFVNLLREARSECRITDSGGLKLIMEANLILKPNLKFLMKEFNDFRSKCGLLWSYDWVSIPLVYTQVVTLSTQAFFLASLLGRQHINPPQDKNVNIIYHQYGEYYFPIFTLLQFILYMGLLKLGEQLINPFGDDDEDFELNWIIDRHLKVSFLGVDILNVDPPPLMKDNYFDETDIKLPYTQAAVAHKVKTYRGSVAAFHVPTEKHGLVIPEFDDEDNNGSDNEEASTVQSSQHNATRSSMWNVFSRKPKMTESQSIPSFDSEILVESGLNPLWQGSVDSIYTQKTGYGTDRSSQGIRGKNEDSKSKGIIIDMPTDVSKSGTATTEADTPTSSIDVPLLYREIDSHSSTPFRKDSSSHTSSIPSGTTSGTQKKMSQSVQQMTEEKVVHNVNVRRSHSTAHRKMRLPLSMFKGSRTVDPKLKIRPFRSRVTFSEDTKTGDKEELIYYYIPIFQTENSSSELSEILDQRELTIDLNQTQAQHLVVEMPDMLEIRNETVLRRQSLDPTTIILPEVGTSQEEEKWLHHQSLPNIQEGQEEEIHNELDVQMSPKLTRKISIRRHTSDRTTERRKSFKRQKPSCQETENEEEIVVENDNLEEKIKTDLSNKKKRKEAKPRQSSTESDTGSYHTACSFLMQISEDSEDMLKASNSSMDSYRSAIETFDPNFDPKIPKITVTQSTPSITSLSSDDQISTKNTRQYVDKKVLIEKTIPKKNSKLELSEESSDVT